MEVIARTCLWKKGQCKEQTWQCWAGMQRLTDYKTTL